MHLFRLSNTSFLKNMIFNLTIKFFHQNEVVYNEFDASNEFFIIKSGKFSV